MGLVLAAATACSNGDEGPVGAQTSSTRPGPQIVAPASLAVLAPRVVGTRVPPPRQGTAVQHLSNQIDEKLTQPARVTPATRVTQKSAAGDQVLVRWTVGHDLPDSAARLRVRTDARTILDLVQKSGLQYGSVLLLALGGASRNGKKTLSIVVRAKFSKSLVRRTKWLGVSANRLFRMADDKPAVIAVGYR